MESGDARSTVCEIEMQAETVLPLAVTQKATEDRENGLALGGQLAYLQSAGRLSLRPGGSWRIKASLPKPFA